MKELGPGIEILNTDDRVYYDPHKDELVLTWTYLGEVIEAPEINFGPCYYIGEL